MDSIVRHPNGSISWEMETVPYDQAYREAMEKGWETLSTLVAEGKSSLSYVILNFADSCQPKKPLS